MSVRRAGMAVAATAGVLMVFFGSAWACSPQASILAIGPPSGPAGSSLALKGQATAAGAPVEIRWNALRGPVLGTAVTDSAGNYVTTAILPQAQPGIYTILAVSQGKPVARLAVELRPLPGTAPSPVVSPNAGGRVNDGRALGQGLAAQNGPSFDVALAVGVGLVGVGLLAAVSVAGVTAVSRRRPTVGQRS